MKVIFVDLDGTISEIGNRLQFIQSKNPDWDAFYAAVGTDKPIESVCSVVRALQVLYKVVFCTGRSDKVYDKTERWLDKNNLWRRETVLLMRKEGDCRPDRIVKKELYRQYLESHFLTKDDVLCAIEDRNSVVEMWRSEGITCLQPQDGNF